MTFKSVMSSIGNAFKTGWNNGNIQKGMSIAGTTAFSVGFMGMAIKSMNNSHGSIFGGGCGCNSFGSMNMFGYSPFNMMGGNMFGGMNMFNPMGSMMGGMGMFSGMDMFGSNMMGGMYGGMNSIGGMNSYGNMMAYQWGQQMMMQQMSQYSGINSPYSISAQTEALETKIEKLKSNPLEKEAVSFNTSNTDTTLGTSFDEGTDAFKASGADDVSLGSGLDGSKDKTTYANEVGKVAQSYIYSISSGDTISRQQFIDHEYEKVYGSNQNITDEQETYYRKQLEYAFVQMDLNGDDEIDWKEMTATMATYDAGGVYDSSKLNGAITSTQYTAALDKLTSGSFILANKRMYLYLYSGET